MATLSLTSHYLPQSQNGLLLFELLPLQRRQAFWSAAGSTEVGPRPAPTPERGPSQAPQAERLINLPGSHATHGCVGFFNHPAVILEITGKIARICQTTSLGGRYIDARCHTKARRRRRRYRLVQQGGHKAQVPAQTHGPEPKAFCIFTHPSGRLAPCRSNSQHVRLCTCVPRWYGQTTRWV